MLGMEPLKEKAKNKCYLSLSTHDKRKRKKYGGATHVISAAERVPCGNIVLWESVGVLKERAGQRQVKVCLVLGRI